MQNIHVRWTRYTKLILYTNCFWVQLSSSHADIILGSYYMFYPTGNFNAEPQLSTNFLHKNYHSHLLAWFHTNLPRATGFIHSVLNSGTDTVQVQRFRAYMFPVMTNVYFLSLAYYAILLITTFYYIVLLRTHNTHFIFIKKCLQTFYHILKCSLHV